VTRIFYIAVPPKATYAAFRKESGMKFVNATNLDRKFGVPTDFLHRGPAQGDVCGLP
jgi:hypothetical protein